MLNMILIRCLQSVGAVVASVAAETVIAVVQLIIVCRELSPLRVIKEGVHYYIAGLVLVLVLLPICRQLPSSVINTVIIALCGAAVYFVMLLIERDEFFLSNIRNALKKKHISR